MENIVYLELLRRGYKVSIGKNDLRNTLGSYKTVEIDFVAENKDGVSYFQVAESVTSPETLQRELIPLKTIPDHCPKFILTRDYGTFDYEWKLPNYKIKHFIHDRFGDEEGIYIECIV